MANPTPEAIANEITWRVFGGAASAALGNRIRQYLAGATINETRVREALALALSASEFQWY
jgi:hypothetical protein